MLAFAPWALSLQMAALAGEPFDGRWAADAKACNSDGLAMPLLVVDTLTLRWRDSACSVRTSYRVRDTWHIGARCSVDGAASDVAIRLKVHGDRLVLDWAGTSGEELRRCP